jgi:hypothetical protein
VRLGDRSPECSHHGADPRTRGHPRVGSTAARSAGSRRPPDRSGLASVSRSAPRGSTAAKDRGLRHRQRDHVELRPGRLAEGEDSSRTHAGAVASWSGGAAAGSAPRAGRRSVAAASEDQVQVVRTGHARGRSSVGSPSVSRYGTCDSDVGGILTLPHKDVADDDQRLHALLFAARHVVQAEGHLSGEAPCGRGADIELRSEELREALSNITPAGPGGGVARSAGL